MAFDFFSLYNTLIAETPSEKVQKYNFFLNFILLATATSDFWYKVPQCVNLRVTLEY